MKEITLLQWNVLYSEPKENVLELIKQLSPDVVCMQELTIGSTFQDGVNVIEYLAEQTGMHQFHHKIPNLAPSHGVGDLANGILSRYPIKETDWRWIQKPQRGGKAYDDKHRLYLEATISVDGQQLTVGTTHVSYTHKYEDTNQRKTEVDNLLSIIKLKDSKFVFTGDLNSTPDSYLVTELHKHLEHCGPDEKELTWTTKPFEYNGFKETELKWRLDYCFATKDMGVVSSEVIETKYSDHLPILLTFKT